MVFEFNVHSSLVFFCVKKTINDAYSFCRVVFSPQPLNTKVGTVLALENGERQLFGKCGPKITSEGVNDSVN